MIIQALCDLFDRLSLAPYGYSVQQVSFVVVVEPDGSHARFESAMVSDEGTAGDPGARRAKSREVRRALIVPGQSKPSGKGINPCFLWDRADYLLGLAPADDDDGPDAERIAACFEEFRARHLAIRDQIADDGFQAVCRFLDGWEPRRAQDDPRVRELVRGFGIFQVRGRKHYVHEGSAVRAWWDENGEKWHPSKAAKNDSVPSMRSLVDGKHGPIARLHEPRIAGVGKDRAVLVGFNDEAYRSYGKSQGDNAPVGVRDAFCYCTALNYLLADERHRVRAGDTTVVFWTDSPRAIELFGQIIGGSGEGQDEAMLTDLRRWADAARQGVRSDLGEARTPFYILGLAPNVARLSVRFWIPSTIGKTIQVLAAHVDAMQLDGKPDGFTTPTLLQIARETVPAKNGWPDEERIPPRLIGEMGRAVLTGLPYPASLLGAVVARARTDGWVNAEKRIESTARIGHRRACIIAACLRRRAKEIPMSLNENHTDPAYHLGRLFALLDTVAEDASKDAQNRPRVNRRDKYFAAASANPVTVFPRLLRLSTFDLKKFPPEDAGFRIGRERQIQAICDRIDTFPVTLTLEEQGLFCLGYYQQRQDIFTRKPSPETATA